MSRRRGAQGAMIRHVERRGFVPGIGAEAGQLLAQYEQRLFDRGAAIPAPDLGQPIPTTRRRVPPDWTDYNGHMNEARYLQAFADATDAFLRLIGVDAGYIATGGSYFTVETHLRHLDEQSSILCSSRSKH